MKVWAYIHPELNILCCAVLPEAVPPDIQAIEFEVESPMMLFTTTDKSGLKHLKKS